MCKRAREEKVRPIWQKPLAVLVIVAVFIGFQALHRMVPDNELPSLPASFTLAIGLGVFLIYIVPWLWRNDSSICRILPHGMARKSRGKWKVSHWSGYLSFSVKDFEAFYVLRLISKKRRRPTEVAVTTDIDKTELAEFLRSAGIIEELWKEPDKKALVGRKAN